MARSTTAEATIVDLSDGTNPITAFLTNANHTFTASEGGVVDNVSGFNTEVVAFIGRTQGTYVTSANYDAAEEYTITSAAYVGSPSGWGTPAVSNAGVVTIPSIGDSATSQVTLRITFSVRDSNNTSVTGLTQDCTLSVVKQGAGGNVINLAPTNQVFTANSSGNLDAGQTDINVEIDTQGSPGTQSYYVSQNGGSFSQVSSTSASAGGISAFRGPSDSSDQTGTIDGDAVRLVIDQTNLGNSNENITIRVDGANGGSDFVTIYKVKTGSAGADAIIAIIESSVNGFVFKNSAGSEKTLTCKVYDAGDGSQISSGVTYTWKYSDGTNVQVTSASDRSVVASGVNATGTGFADIKVDASDVTNVLGLRCEVDVS